MARSITPEGIVTRAAREFLRLMRVPHIKHWSGPMSFGGIPDIIGTLPPAGRGLFVELKAPGKRPRPDQLAFLTEMKAAGAVAFWTDEPQGVVRVLATEGYAPAVKLAAQLGLTPRPELT